MWRRASRRPFALIDPHRQRRLEHVGGAGDGHRGGDAGADRGPRDEDRGQPAHEVAPGGRLGHRCARDRVHDRPGDLEPHPLHRRELGGGIGQLGEPHPDPRGRGHRREGAADVDRRRAVADRDAAQTAAGGDGRRHARGPLGGVRSREEQPHGGSGDAGRARHGALRQPELAGAALEPHVQGHPRPDLGRCHRGGGGGRQDEGGQNGEDQAYSHAADATDHSVRTLRRSSRSTLRE